MIEKKSINVVLFLSIITLISFIIINKLLIFLFKNKINLPIKAFALSTQTNKNLKYQNFKTFNPTSKLIITIIPNYVKKHTQKQISKTILSTQPHKPQNPKFYINFNQKQILLTQKELQRCIKKYPKSNSQRINKDCLRKLLHKKNISFEHLTQMYYGQNKFITIRQEDFTIDLNKLTKIINTIIKTHKNYQSVYINAPITNLIPNTDGKLAPIYVEVDMSRQLVFLWNHGKYETFKMSGAYKNYYHIGIYKIFYKSQLAWSKIANVWMPYWMAFTKDKNTNGLVGLHGLIYYCPGRKEKYCKNYIYEPESNLGKPKSLGCLRVSIKDAKYIYNKIKVGDYIIVHE